MKRIYLLFFASFCVLLLSGFQFFDINKLHYSSGPDYGYSGDPANGFQTCASCHFGSTTRIFDSVITSNIPASGYVPNTTYSIQVKIKETGISRYGFQISPQNTKGDFLGKLIASDPIKTQLNADDEHYINHTYRGNSFPNETGQWSFEWTAPDKGSGSVTFYGAFLLANSSDTPIGDKVVTSTLNVTESTLSALSSESTNGLGLLLFPNPANDQLTCSISLPQDAKDVTFSILQPDGKVVYARFHGTLSTSQQQFTFPVSQLTKGIYYLQIKGKGIQSLKSFYKN